LPDYFKHSGVKIFFNYSLVGFKARIVGFVCALFVCGQIMGQNVIYVTPFGNDNNAGTAWSTAFRTLQRALQVAGNGQQVWVRGGIYFPDDGPGKTNNSRDMSFEPASGVTLLGGFVGIETQAAQRNFRANSTILSGEIQQDANAANNSFILVNVFQKSDIVLDGFVIERATDDAIPAAGTPRNIGRGAGLFLFASNNITVRNCHFRLNRARLGGACMINQTTAQFFACEFTRNTAVEQGGALFVAGGNNRLSTIANTIFTDNVAAISGGAISAGSDLLRMDHCLIYRNSAPSGGAINNSNVPLPINSSIIFGNGNRPVVITEIAPLQLNSCIIDFITIAPLTADSIYRVYPGWADSANNDFRLLACSFALNRGRTFNQQPATDFLGNARSLQGQPDIGPYEFTESENNQVVFVNDKATGTNSGTNWTNAYTRLQDGLARCQSCPAVKEVWVARGIYYPDEGVGIQNNNRFATFAPRQYLKMYGGFGGFETNRNFRFLGNQGHSTLDGNITQGPFEVQNSNKVVTLENLAADFVLDGFMIRNGFTNTIFPERDAKGAGLFINNCGAITVTNCYIQQNTAPSAPALSISNCNPVISNCVIRNNKTTFNNGALWNDNASPQYIHCTIANNNITGSDFMVMHNSNGAAPQIINSIIRGTSPSVRGGNPMILHSSIQNPTVMPGAGNTNSDPLFVQEATGNLKLGPCSPAINAATPLASTPPTDIMGWWRGNWGVADMGAFERQVSRTLFVDAAGLEDGDGSRWSNSEGLRSLGIAIDALNRCPDRIDRINISTGTYPATGSAVFTINAANKTIIGGYPPGGGSRLPQFYPVNIMGEIRVLQSLTIDGINLKRQ
jgi:hypothetical protein